MVAIANVIREARSNDDVVVSGHTIIITNALKTSRIVATFSLYYVYIVPVRLLMQDNLHNGWTTLTVCVPKMRDSGGSTFMIVKPFHEQLTSYNPNKGTLEYRAPDSFAAHGTPRHLINTLYGS